MINVVEEMEMVEFSKIVNEQFVSKTVTYNKLLTNKPINGIPSVPLFTDGDYVVFVFEKDNFDDYFEFFNIGRVYFYTFKDNLVFVLTNDEKFIIIPEIFDIGIIGKGLRFR